MMNRNRALDDDPETYVGQTVVGVIETEFDSGYLITVTVGSEKLNGLLYQIGDPAVNQFAVVPHLMDGVNLGDSNSEGVSLGIQVGSVEQESAERKTNAEISVSEGKWNPTVGASSKREVKDPKAPRRVRSPYQIYVSKECDRLKRMHRRVQGRNNLKTAIDSWKNLSPSDRMPYIEESQKDRERFDKEMAAYKKLKNMKGSDTELRTWNLEGYVRDFNNDYHVSLQTEETNIFYMPEEAMAAFTAELMKHGEQLDATLQIRWDDDFLSET